MKRPFASTGWIVALLMAPLLLGIGPCEQNPNPMVFVHGGSGSGAQFESQAMRFASNGYPQDYIRVLEYDSSAISTILPDVHAALDDLIAELQVETGHAQVDLLGHSLGTFVSQAYLADPARAANVAHYVNIDGSTAAAPPGGVPTLALWAGTGAPGREIVGAANVTIPDQTHIQTATSKESFVEMYRFFRGHAPITTHVVPEIFSKVSGRASLFPQNSGLDGATLEVWRVKGSTGARIGHHPTATFAIGPDGSWGPFIAWYGQHYEFALLRDGQADLRYFYEPFIRSDGLVRLNAADALSPFIPSGPDYTDVTVVRYKEFWGDRGAENDVLAFNGTDVINPTIFATGSIGAAASAYFGFDVGQDGVSNLTTPVFPFSALAFLAASDLSLPSSPAGKIAIETVPRGDFSKARTLNVPNVPSSEARVVVQLYDFEP